MPVVQTALHEAGVQPGSSTPSPPHKDGFADGFARRFKPRKLSRCPAETIRRINHQRRICIRRGFHFQSAAGILPAEQFSRQQMLQHACFADFAPFTNVSLI